MDTFFQDARQALRRLRAAPAFTIATILTLALGIGATTAIFTLVHAVLLKSLPVVNPGELYRIGRDVRCCFMNGYSQDKEFSLVSYELYTYLRDHTDGFSELAAFPSVQHLFGVRRSGSSEAAHSHPGEFVSGNAFSTFGLRAHVGRTLTPEDDRAGAAPVAVMSYRLWVETYGSDPSVVGSMFNLNDRAITVVGVAPPGFFGETLRSTPPDFFLPLNTEPFIHSDTDLKKYDTHWLALIGRIRPGAAPASIEAGLRVALKQWLRSHWGEMSASDRAKFGEQTVFLSPGGAGITSMRQQYEQWLLILMTVSGLVLLIVCANVGNLMLVRGMERQRQTALTLALGAPVSRVVRCALTESVVLSLLGGAAGLAVAFAGTRLILYFAFPSLPGSAGVPIDASPSTPVLLFALAASLLTGMAFGIAPAWMTTRVDPIEALRGAGRSTDRAGLLPRKTLVVLQVAVSLVLLSAAGLLTAALQRLEHLELGFAQDHRVVATMDPRLAGYRPDRLSPLYARIHDAVTRIPAVASAALCLYSPLGRGGWFTRVWIDGHLPPGPKDDNVAAWNRVTAGYFDVVGTPIVKGRGISEEDTATSRPVAVIDETFARTYFRNEDPIGKHFGRKSESSREFEVVGVVLDAKYSASDLDARARPSFFLAEPQAEYSQTNLGSLFLHDVVVRTKPGVQLSTAALRQAIDSVDPRLPLISIHTMQEQVAGQFTQQRLIARLVSLFGALSLALASIGLYGVTAHNAGRRVGEIGVRMALGARRGDVVRLVVRGALTLILFGLLVGVPLTFAAGRLLTSQLHGMSAFNPAVTLTAVVALALSALVASFVPAFRASSVSPVDALRTE